MATTDPLIPPPTTPPVDPAATTPPPATGLMTTPAPTAATYTGAQGTAAKWDVTPDQTVQGQVKKIIDDNSPLMQQAETRALQKANARGLMNSSIAVGAGQSALYDAATPIATADAATYGNSAQFNAGNEQQMTLANQNATNAAGQFNAGETNKLTQIQAQQEGDLARIAASGQVQKDLAAFSASAAKDLADIEAKYKGLTQASSSAASVMNTTMAAIARIMEDSSLDAAAKQKAIDIYNSNANTSLKIIGSLAGDVELGSFMDAIIPKDAQAPLTPEAAYEAAYNKARAEGKSYAEVLAAATAAANAVR